MTCSQDSTNEDQQSSVGLQWWGAGVQALGTSVVYVWVFLNQTQDGIWLLKPCLPTGRRRCRFVDFGLGF